MKMNMLIPSLAAVLCVVPAASAVAADAAAQAPAMSMPLWPKGQIPGRAAAGPEKEVPSRGDNVIRITDVAEPAISIFKVAGAAKPTPAVIVCPGGGYSILAYNKEGTEIATWLNSIGVTAVVLKYRVPGNQDGAFQDLQRAMRIVRHSAADWNIAPDRIGVMGFSAGGHLSARLSTNPDKPAYPKLDPVDDEKLRPDFAILVYPAYLSRVPGKLAADLPLGPSVPPIFMVHTEDDKSFIAGSKALHEALDAAKLPHEFFLCATGGHGYGLRSDKEVAAWPEKCRAWLTKNGIL